MAEALSLEDIEEMHKLKVMVQYANERKAHIVAANVTPSQLLEAELLDMSNISMHNMPSWVKNFKQLKKLDLSNNSLGMNDMLETLTSFSKLEVLNLSSNPLFQEGNTSLMSVWKSLPEMRELYLRNTGGEERNYGSLQALTHLQQLDLSQNNLSNNIDLLDLKPLASLEILNLSNNNIRHSPLAYLPTVSLSHLNLSNNKLTHISYVKFPRLEVWNLLGNGAVRLADTYEDPFTMKRLKTVQYDTDFDYENLSNLPQGLKRKLHQATCANGERDIIAYNDCNNDFLEPKMVVIPRGVFKMGCASGKDCDSNEKPVHEVNLASFYLARTEVTFDQWDACVRAKGCSHKPDDRGWGRGKRPVIYVSWNDTQEYIQWINKETGKHYRLPTEAEWEYAARLGTKTKYWWGNQDPSCSKQDENGASFNGGKNSDCYFSHNNKFRGTEIVASYAANSWGLYDMYGNVLEWVQDNYHAYTVGSKDGSAWESGDTYRVLRGGSWFHASRYLRSASRLRSAPDNRVSNHGFRLAWSKKL